MRPLSVLVVIGLTLGTLGLSGCVQDNGQQGAISFTTVMISDEPSENFSHINITFSQVKIHKYADENDTGWIEFDSPPKTIDLITLHEQDLKEVLGVENITVGNYSKLWIVIDNATGVLKQTNETIIFDVPSGDLKIQHHFELREGNTTIKVELDIERSILYNPQGNVYKLLPQIASVSMHYNDEDEDLAVDAHGDYQGNVGEPIQFTATATGGDPPYSWHWDFGDGTTATEQSPTHAYTAAGNYTVTLTITDALTTATDSAPVNITPPFT